MPDREPDHHRGFGEYASQFFTNWREYDGPVGTKLWLTTRNRLLSVTRLKGCCGHHGEPGC
ncbi:MAG TPA: hypothetical protein VGR13_05925 [Actinomycetota bacterium]|nr:hypothetical protein [Actinomycetota bacterium]